MGIKEDIINKIKELEEQLKEVSKRERSVYFIELMRTALVDDRCTIILQGHEEWQFQERFSVRDIANDLKGKLDKLLVEALEELKSEKI